VRGRLGRRERYRRTSVCSGPPRAKTRFPGSERPTQHGNGLSYERLSEGNWAFNLRPVKITVPTERENSAFYRHEEEQWLYILSGRLRFEISGEEMVLEEGDAVHFDTDQSHRFEALDGREVEVIVVACAIPYLLLKSYL